MVGLVILTVSTNLFLALSHPETIIPNLASSSHADSFFATDKLTGLMSQLPFLIFAITAFGGMDTVSNLVDKMGNQKNKFSKAVLVGGGFILLFYFLDIMSWAAGSDYTHVRALTNQHLANLMYGLIDLLSRDLSKSLGLSKAAGDLVNQLYLRYTALTMFTAYVSLLATIGYAPLKVLLKALSADQSSARIFKKNRYDVASRVVYLQAGVVSLFVIFLSLGTPIVSQLYNQLTLMTNLSRSLPYLIVAISYPFFKAKFSEDYLTIIREKWLAKLLAVLVVLSITLAIGFEIYSTWLSDGIVSSLFLVIGPVLAALVADIIYTKTLRRKRL
ncbi:hypothetical protein Hs20B_03280 [Lactococcus insecticola]|uniref:Amino acid permease n=2 Tax=Pseudolactococcus insecticola TaxID=2709158 RepID=A0A6A0B3M3_9LACT|nr:hypothetical protein Hs20B_03280 [Lactococcus insecticola]